MKEGLGVFYNQSLPIRDTALIVLFRLQVVVAMCAVKKSSCGIAMGESCMLLGPYRL